MSRLGARVGVNHSYVTLVTAPGTTVPTTIASPAYPAAITVGQTIQGGAAVMYISDAGLTNASPLLGMFFLVDSLSAANFQPALPTAGPVYLRDGTFDVFEIAIQLGDGSDGQAEASDGLAGVVNRAQVFNGDSFDRERAATRFVSAAVTANGNTTVFDPGAGNNFRLLGYQIELTGNAGLAAPGLLTMTLGTNIVHAAFVPIAGGAINGVIYNTGPVSLGKLGFAGAADANLVMNLSAAITSGHCRVNVQLVEETP